MGLLSWMSDAAKSDPIRKIANNGNTPSAQQNTEAAKGIQDTWLNPESPQYKGPAYYLAYDNNGQPTARKSTEPAALMDQEDFVNRRGKYAPQPENTAPVTTQGGIDYVDQALNRLDTPVQRPASLTRQPTPQRAPLTNTFTDVSRAPGTTAVQRQAPTNSVASGVSTAGVDVGKLKALTGADGGTAGGPGAEAPLVNRQKIDEIMGGLRGYENKMAELAEDNTGLSVAEAQLKKATDLANLQAGIDTEASQRAAMGQARSARSRGDRALLERGAIGEAAFVGQEAARTAALRRAQNEGDLAQLRAAEADADRRFRLDALGKAADLGLNRNALEVDISKTNLESATNWINQEFNQLGIDKQLNQQQAESLLGFARDMAAIQFQYDQLEQQDQQAADALIMQKYGIDQQTMTALKQIKEAGKFKWDQVLAGMAGGAGQAATTALFASDERVKKDFAPVLADELDELLGALSAQTWKYKEPDKHGAGLRFGPMAQELERTRLGKSMVKPDASGTKFVDTGQLTLATASGLAHLHDRLRALEAATPAPTPEH